MLSRLFSQGIHWLPWLYCMVNYEKFVRSHAGSSRVFMVMTDYEDSATAKAGLNGRTCVSLPGSKCSGCPFLGIVRQHGQKSCTMSTTTPCSARQVLLHEVIYNYPKLAAAIHALLALHGEDLLVKIFHQCIGEKRLKFQLRNLRDISSTIWTNLSIKSRSRSCSIYS